MPAQKTFRSIRVRGVARFDGPVVGVPGGGEGSQLVLHARRELNLSAPTELDLVDPTPAGKQLVALYAVLSRAQNLSLEGEIGFYSTHAGGPGILPSIGPTFLMTSPDRLIVVASSQMSASQAVPAGATPRAVWDTFGPSASAALDFFYVLIDA